MNEIAYIKIITILVFLIVSIGLYAQEPVNQSDSTNMITVSNDSIRIDSMFLSPLNHFIPIDSLINYTKKFIGTPYRYGGRSEKGFDCSGFVYYVFKNFGLELPPSSRSQVNVGLPVAKDSMQ
ncbi:MAG: NlpC/P60 family protein, partial [Ignavibacteria bacterium]|nr:NlpC/P60 family protein [Ignavibacteria bacterium]